jgi:hypothetical protein
MMKTMMAFGILLLGCTMAMAGGATRTWVSGVGSDQNPCSRTAPCKTFAGALANTSAGGQINVIDAGAYGSVTITQSVTIDASESFAGVLTGDGVSGIIVNAGVDDVVVLRGLTISGNGLGTDGIRFVAGKRLHVEDCRIFGFTQRGIFFAPKDKSQLLVKDTIIRENAQAGILVQPEGGAASVSIDHVRLEANQNGLSVLDASQATVRDSVMANNSSNGVLAIASAAGAPEVVMESCITTNNGLGGIKTSGAGGNTATVQISNVTVTHNDTGLLTGAGGQVVSYTNNTIAANKTDGAPDKQFTQQ